MKIGWSKGEKEKKVEIDADVERIAEKAMDLHEKELEEAKRQEKYKEKKLKLIITAILGIMIIIFVILGAILGNNVDSFLYIITLFAFLLVIPIVSIWKSKDD